MEAETPSPEELQSWIEQAREGNQAAFGWLMKSHYEHTFRLVVSITGRGHDARDICQEIWLTVWKQLPHFRGESKFTTWLHPIAVRKALDHLRRHKRWYHRFLPLLSSGEDSSTPAVEAISDEDTRASAEREERRAMLQRLLDSLPTKLRAVLALREVEGLAYDEIAKILRCPTGTVMSRLHQARRHLLNKIKDLPPCD